MSPKNPHGDLVLTDPKVLRAVAQPSRYALFRQLQRHGPATVAELAVRLDSAASAVDDDLRVLAEHELVRPVASASGDPDAAWEAAATGMLIEVPDTAEGQAASRLLTTQMFREAAAVPVPWWADDEPRLSPEWRKVAGVINAGLWMTPDEQQALNDQIEELTAPYALRAEADRPDDALRVRVQCYLMPAPD